MNLMDTMERTLQTSGQSGRLRITPPIRRPMRWPPEFVAPIEGALHSATPKGRDYRRRGAPTESPDPLHLFK